MTDTPWDQDRRKKILDETLDPDLADRVGFSGGFTIETALMIQLIRSLKKP